MVPQMSRSRPARSWRKPEVSSPLARHAFLRPLRLLCACLSAGQRGQTLDLPSAATLAAPSTDLMSLSRLAGRHLVTPMLATCIGDPEIRHRLPEDFILYLEFVHAENTRRNDAVRRQLGQAAACLNRIDIEPLLLKGAIRLVDGLYPDPGWRFMRDIDLLIRRDRLGQGVACLESLGYRSTCEATELPAKHRHLPPLYRSGAVAVVELHTELLDTPAVLPAERVLARSRPVDLDGARVRVPDSADQLLHLVGHDRFDGDLRSSGLFVLRNVFETALLCQDESRLRDALDRVASTPLARYARARIDLAARLFPGHLDRPLDLGVDANLLAGALVGLEHLDANGGLRRLFGYGRLQLGNLLASPVWRKHFATNIQFSEYRRHCLRRLRQKWSGD
jgi:hypothetical protein